MLKNKSCYHYNANEQLSGQMSGELSDKLPSQFSGQLSESLARLKDKEKDKDNSISNARVKKFWDWMIWKECFLLIKIGSNRYSDFFYQKA